MSSHKATLRKPTGFRNQHNESPVTVVGFASGEHRDAGGYDRPGTCMLAIIADEQGDLDAVPIRWVRIAPIDVPTPSE